MGNELTFEELPEGPWKADHEAHPNREYRFLASGYRCKILRHEWNWNGYVTLPETHPDAKKHYNDLQDIDVHGGLTFFRAGTFGFDTKHLCDLQPGNKGLPMPGFPQTYWSFDMVLAEVKRLAATFKARDVTHS